MLRFNKLDIKTINMILPILIASITSVAFGFLWFSPFLFGKQWATLSGLTPENMTEMKSKGMAKVYAINFLMEIITAVVLFNIFKMLGTTSIIGSLEIALVLWLGFMLPIEVGQTLWMKKPITLFLINSLHRLGSIVIIGVALMLLI